jgi:hypothetical protein
MSDPQNRVGLLLPRLPWRGDDQTQGRIVPGQRQVGRAAKGQQEQTEV